jgi:salicylate hydroxylase
MAPHMSQGAACALEDAVVLSRCLDRVESTADIAGALRAYQETRHARTSKIQLTSRQNNWMRTPTDADWLYGYDAFSAPLQGL